MKRLLAIAALSAALVIPGIALAREEPTVVGIQPRPTPVVVGVTPSPEPTPRPEPSVVGLPPVEPTPAPSVEPSPWATLPATDTE